jgi:radical SAM superfamily enzyme YgiQ (UPF0313 family)
LRRSDPLNVQRIALVYPGRPVTPTQKTVYVHLPYASLCLAAYVRERGYHADVIDMRVTDWEQYDFSSVQAVGIGCMTGHQIRFGLQLASLARRQNPAVKLLWGGVHPTLFPRQTAAHPLVDFVVRGEGEETLYHLLEMLNGRCAPAMVTGLTFRDGSDVIETPDRDPIADLDCLPFPAYDLVNMADYPNVREVFDYQTSRGCPFRCAFCYNLAFSKRKWRAKTATKVLSEIEMIKQLYGVNCLGLVDDEFFINRKRTEAIIDGLLESGLDVHWSASCRLDILQRYSDDFMNRLRRSGCRKLYFGAESGSQRILDLISKDIRVKDMFVAAAQCVRGGIAPILSFMSGFPRETTVDLRATYQTISKLWEMDSIVVVNGCFIYNPYPGGPLFDEASSKGMELPSSFDGWGQWDYKYDADLPWLHQDKQREMKMMFTMVRFSYYWKELGRKNSFIYKYVARMCLLPMKISFRIRWKHRLFGFGIEWKIWAALMQRVFGFM